MTLLKKFALLAVLAMLPVMLNACAHPAPALPPAGDFCPNSHRITVAPAPAPGVNDPGNQLDTDETVTQVLEHNAVVDRLCPLTPDPKPAK